MGIIEKQEVTMQEHSNMHFVFQFSKPFADKKEGAGAYFASSYVDRIYYQDLNVSSCSFLPLVEKLFLMDGSIVPCMREVFLFVCSPPPPQQLHETGIIQKHYNIYYAETKHVHKQLSEYTHLNAN